MFNLYAVSLNSTLSFPCNQVFATRQDHNHNQTLLHIDNQVKVIQVGQNTKVMEVDQSDIEQGLDFEPKEFIIQDSIDDLIERKPRATLREQLKKILVDPARPDLELIIGSKDTY